MTVRLSHLVSKTLISAVLAHTGNNYSEIMLLLGVYVSSVKIGILA